MSKKIVVYSVINTTILSYIIIEEDKGGYAVSGYWKQYKELIVFDVDKTIEKFKNSLKEEFPNEKLVFIPKYNIEKYTKDFPEETVVFNKLLEVVEKEVSTIEKKKNPDIVEEIKEKLKAIESLLSGLL